MKKNPSLKRFSALLILLIGVPILAFSQDNYKIEAKELTDKMIKSLDLSEVQEKSIYQINLDFYKALAEAKKVIDDKEKVFALKAVVEDRERKVDSILTKEQLKMIKRTKKIYKR